eukprot:scaffold110367_cov22-Tisochrysis_lutea.AAC.3
MTHDGADRVGRGATPTAFAASPSRRPPPPPQPRTLPAQPAHPRRLLPHTDRVLLAGCRRSPLGRLSRVGRLIELRLRLDKGVNLGGEAATSSPQAEEEARE